LVLSTPLDAQRLGRGPHRAPAASEAT
jgi:hypothetical protein